MFPSLPPEILSRELHSRTQWVGVCLLRKYIPVCDLRAMGAPSSSPLLPALSPCLRSGTWIPSFPVSSRAGGAALPRLSAWGPRSSAATGGWKNTDPMGFREAGLPEGRLLFPVQVVPVLPVLGSPGQQLLPHGLEVLLDECLQLLWGNAVLMGGRQFPEVLQNLVWGPPARRGQVDSRSLALIEALLCLVLLSVIFGAKASGGGVPRCLTWS